MRVKNILVFPCGSEVALEIVEACKFTRHFHLIGGSSVDDHGRFAYSDYIGNLPMLGDGALISDLARIVKERKIDAIYPAMDAVAAELKAHEKELGCIVVSSPTTTADTCMSKLQTYEKLQEYVRVPKTYNSLDEVRYPAFVKPDIGYGSRGTFVAETAKDLKAAILDSELLVLEYLPGEEYTVDCFTDARGDLLYCGPRTRERVRNGISVRSVPVSDKGEFRSFADSINGALELRGGWFFQVKRDSSGQLCLLEVACRIAGSSSLARARGANLPLAALFDATGYTVAIETNDYDIELDRALDSSYALKLDYSQVYVDYDDCLVLNNGSINTELIAYLYECVNLHKRITLLSRHKGSLADDLAQKRLDVLFDEVIHIGPSESKADYVTNLDCIFIDDSFAERKDVAKLGVPVFAPDIVKCLI